MTLGDLVREARERLGWTQSHLAERVGVTPSFVTKVEKNEALPSYDRLLALANVLVLDSEQLLSLMEQAKQERTEQRIRTRGAAVRGAYGLVRTRGGSPGNAPDTVHPPTTAEQLGREILDNPDLQRAFTFVRAALADPDLKPAVLKTLEAFAQQAKPEAQDKRVLEGLKSLGKRKG
jgi:transcriptional regulator with XRE-family HTH domain